MLWTFAGEISGIAAGRHFFGKTAVFLLAFPH